MIEPSTSIVESYGKELKNKNPKDLNNQEVGDFLVGIVINVTGKTIKNKFPNLKCSGLALTSNEIKYIIKVTRSLENRGIFLKGTIEKTTSQEGGFLNFLRPLIFMPLAKHILVPLRLTVAASVADGGIQKKVSGKPKIPGWGVIRTSEGVVWAGEGTTRAG